MMIIISNFYSFLYFHFRQGVLFSSCYNPVKTMSLLRNAKLHRTYRSFTGFDRAVMAKSFMESANAVLMELWYNLYAVNSIKQGKVDSFLLKHETEQF